MIKNKFPTVRFKQIKGNPRYLLFWIRRLLFLKRASYKYAEKYKDFETLSASETLSYIINNKCSIIRFGDGEFGVISGAGIFPPDSDWSQRYSDDLKNELINQMNLCNNNILISFPSKKIILSKEYNEFPNFIPSMHTETRFFLWKFLKEKKIYGDWAVFMPVLHTNMNWSKISEFIKYKTIVVVTGGTEKLYDIKLGMQTHFIECGKHDAFERRREIINDIDKLIESKMLDKESTLFWVSLGCTAGCIINHLEKKGFIGWDTGHIFRFAEKELRKLKN